MTREKKRRSSFEDISSDTAKQALKKNKKRQKRLGAVIVLCCLFSLLFLFGCGLMGVSALVLNDLTTTVVPQDDASLGIPPVGEKHEAVNLAVFAVETARPGEALVGSCAYAAVLSVNADSNTVKIVSVDASTWVDIGDACPTEDGYGTLGMSYAYGGPACAMRALNGTLGLDIRDYIAVDVNDFGAILEIFGLEMPENGSVLKAVLNKVSEMPAKAYPHVVSELSGMTETSLFVGDVLRLSGLFSDPFTVERFEVPGAFVPGEWQERNGSEAAVINKSQAAGAVYDFLYTFSAASSRGAESSPEPVVAAE